MQIFIPAPCKLGLGKQRLRLLLFIPGKNHNSIKKIAQNTRLQIAIRQNVV